MHSYLVKLVYQIICGEGCHTPQFDEQLRFVAAGSEEEALQKGAIIGAQEEEAFTNNRQQLVQWKFVAVTELYTLDELADGAEVFSQVKETDDAGTYRAFLLHKAARLEKRISSLIPQTV